MTRSLRLVLCIWICALIGCASLLACGSSSESSVDAQPGMVKEDGGGGGADEAWQLVSVPVSDLVLDETVDVNSERTARLLVTSALSECERKAAPALTWDERNSALYIDMRVFRPARDCPGTAEPQIRPVSVRFPATGRWTIYPGAPGAQQSERTLAVEVMEPPARACMPPMTTGCEMDCDCAAGEVCVSASGFAGPFTQCARACEFDRECEGTGRCVSVDDGLSFTCSDAFAECADDYPCPDGYSCRNGTCTLGVTLSSETRAPCTSDSDCESPLHCVASADRAGQARCELLCPNFGPGWCSAMHVCGTAAEDASGQALTDSVCVWLGE